MFTFGMIVALLLVVDLVSAKMAAAAKPRGKGSLAIRFMVGWAWRRRPPFFAVRAATQRIRRHCNHSPQLRTCGRFFADGGDNLQTLMSKELTTLTPPAKLLFLSTPALFTATVFGIGNRLRVDP